ncbi:MAG: hypothetical protein M1820_001821 [Bogoriella megaspora]|nr:MAG: hypothetical protein M1820_001821 [Bogoriella megaspora]
MSTENSSSDAIQILDLSQASLPDTRDGLLKQLRGALFNTGFLYISNHGVPQSIINDLVNKLPTLFDLPDDIKNGLSKRNSPHFLGYSGFAEETTLGKKDLREQFDFGSDVPNIWQDNRPRGIRKLLRSRSDEVRDQKYTELYWRLRGPNQWPPEDVVPGFRKAYMEYHDAVQELSYRFVHLIEEAFEIPSKTFDSFWKGEMQPQHRIKLVKYPPNPSSENTDAEMQGVGAHKDSSGWLTFLYQVGKEEGLEVLGPDGNWIAAPPIDGTFVVNFGNAFEAATECAVKATVHRVKTRDSSSVPRFSIPFFQGLPLDMSVSEIRSYIPESVRRLRAQQVSEIDRKGNVVSTFLDPRWDSLGESQLRKWIRSHEDVGRKWYGDSTVKYYLQ